MEGRVMSRYEDWMEQAQRLDTYYIPTRYPNGFSAGKPADYYSAEGIRL